MPTATPAGSRSCRRPTLSPPVFFASSGSEDTVAFCARRDFTPTYFAGMHLAGPMSEHYRDIAAKSGHRFPAGRNQCLVRWMQIGKSEEDALDRIRAWDLDIWKNFYASMGRRKVENNDYFGSLVNSGLFAFGTVDSVRRQLVGQWKVFPAEYVALVNHYAQMPQEPVLETLDTFMTRIKPDLDKLVEGAAQRATP